MLLSLLMGAAIAAETPQTTEADAPVVIEGVRNIDNAITDYVRRMGQVKTASPLVRFDRDHYCPRVVGLSEARNAEIERRMHDVADAAGIRPAAAGCETSALVIFAKDREAMAEALKAEHPEFFRALGSEDVDFYGEDTPVLSWTLAERIDRNNNPVERTIGAPPTVSSSQGGRLSAMTRPRAVVSVVLVELDAIVGLTPVQVADYALMRSLLDGEPSDLSGLPSILNALEAAEDRWVPESLTQWDLAYLKGRYASSPWAYGGRQQAKILGTMRRSLLEE